MNYFQKRPLTYPKARSFLINFDEKTEQPQEHEYPSNFIKTSRYTLLSYLPVSLMMQFKRYANIYFLVSAIIQSIPILSPLNPFSAISPLVFVLALSMIREGFEDFQRHKSDNEVNATAAYIYQGGQKIETTWATLCVGDLIYVAENDSFPTDLIVLGTSIPSGVCYIETSSLDGEKNLKAKSALKETQDLFSSLSEFCASMIQVNAQIPSQALYEYEGAILLQEKQLSVGPKQLLLRGAYLRNTKWILGVSVYTGQDTKIMKNAEPGRVKQSAIEYQMNKLILAILCIQLSLCIISSALSSVWLHTNGINHWYLGYIQSTFRPNLDSLLVFFSYFLLFNTMIPISLIVSLEFVKVFQSYFIGVDEEMYVASRDRWASVKTTTINEELGQVEYIFSDKTGTLTCNQMEFKYCIIGDSLYGDKDQQQSVQVQNETNIVKPRQSHRGSIHPLEQLDHEPHQHSVFNFRDKELQAIIANENESARQLRNLILKSQDGEQKIELKTQHDLVDYFFFLLASAHECLYLVDRSGDPVYQGPSPDEITLVDAAARLGYKFTGASSSEQVFEIMGRQRKVELLQLFEFDSDRKRMSVIVRDGGVIKLLIKGADSIIKARLSKTQEQPYLSFIDDQLDAFSRVGLRTLIMATKILSEQEYKIFDESILSVINSPNRTEEISRLADELERDLYLIGATAVEDKLQPLVPETIADFLQANIKVWMLTGDKLETAENIAKSCRLIQGDMTVLRLSEKTTLEVQSKLADIRATYDLCVAQKRKKTFLIEGESLAILLQNEDLKLEFVDISQSCESVVCCRVTPRQKAQVVKLIKDKLNKITLAIGDGANDVNMIQQAHIGIGLYGNEGMRAVQSSDFAFGEFRCLWRLLFVHGHWSYIRISEMILYFFYKNMIFTVPQFYFAFFSGYSAQSFYDDWYITFYNMIFTALPLIIRATFDQDVNYKFLISKNADKKVRKIELKKESYLKNKFPLLYSVGQQKQIFTIPNFIWWAVQGVVNGLIVFFGGYAAFDFTAVDITGFTMGLSGFSMTLISAIVFIVNLKISLFTKFWTWLNFVSILIFSIFIYFMYMLISHKYIGTQSLYTPLTLLKTPHFWLLIILLCGTVLLYDLVQGQIVRELFVTQLDELRVFTKQFSGKLRTWNYLDHNQEKKASKEQSFWEGLRKEQDQDANIELIQLQQGSND